MPYVNPLRGRVDHAQRVMVRHTTVTQTTYACPFCDRVSSFKKGTVGTGRGYGLKTGGALSSQMAAHIRNDHPEELAKAAAKAVQPQPQGTGP